ncbi:MAG: ATP-binding protein, partial [Acidobacteriota bacterium]
MTNVFRLLPKSPRFVVRSRSLRPVLWAACLGAVASPAFAHTDAVGRPSAWPLAAAGLGVLLVVLAGLWWRREQELRGQIQRSAADSSADLEASRVEVASGAERISAILQSILEGIITTDIDGRIVRMNRSAEKLLDKSSSELAGLSLGEAVRLRSEEEGEEGFDALASLRESLTPTQFDGLFHLAMADGSERRIELSGAPVRPQGELDGFVLALRDVTDRQLVEAELAKAQKLESLGLLASGIAHDFNNLLTIALGNLSLLQTEEELAEGLTLPLDEVEKALVRARALSDQLLTFASGGVPRNRPIDLAELVNRSISMVFRDDSGLFDVDVPDDLPNVDVDPEQIGQVLNNLLLEARQEAGEGKVRISARREKVGGIRGTKLAPGSYVRLEIFDGGAGLSGDEISRIFEPYVASRRSGTGMALATSQAIVKRHRGAIEVTSEVGSGTTFSILLRTAKGARKNKPKTTERARRSSDGRGRVLIMDDESSILTLLSAALKAEPLE